MSCHHLKNEKGEIVGIMCMVDIYKFKGYTFENHSYFGPMLVYAKNFEPRDRQPGERSKFWGVFEKFQKLSTEEKERYRIAG